MFQLGACSSHLAWVPLKAGIAVPLAASVSAAVWLLNARTAAFAAARFFDFAEAT